MLNILIPMAGKGKRFTEAGYTELKPFIRLNGLPMIDWVLHNILQGVDQWDYKVRVIVVIEPDLEDLYAKDLASLRDKYNKFDLTFVSTNGEKQQGQAWSCLIAKHLIDTEDDLLIANCDQIIHDNNSQWLHEWLHGNLARSQFLDGSLALFWNNHPKWSYAKIANGLVVETAEKQVISEHATVGLYYFRHGHDFVSYAQQMIVDGETINGEYYVAPVYNRMIQDGAIIRPHWFNKVFGIGTPVDLAKFAAYLGVEIEK